jgi:uncharacterized protein YeaO (DUF488 family)
MGRQHLSQRTAPRRADRVALKRVYAPHSAQDGTRILVDRLWPRGLSKDKAKIDIWLKDIAPSDGLRRRVHGDPEAWAAFVLDYGRELAQEPAASAARELLGRIDREPVTLIYAARNEAQNNAVALKDWLVGKLGAGRARAATARAGGKKAKVTKR